MEKYEILDEIGNMVMMVVYVDCESIVLLLLVICKERFLIDLCGRVLLIFVESEI